MVYKILLAEDEKNLRETIRLNLEMDGYQVSVAADGKQALKAFKASSYHLVILDIMMPEINGLDVCRAIRAENSEVPVLFLTAKSSGEDRIQGLRTGGDDYLTKPFELEELLLRIQNLLKRGAVKEKELKEFSFGSNKIDFLTYEILGQRGKEQITKKEIQLLKLLIRRRNEVVSRDEILQALWEEDASPSARTIDNLILAFRKYFEKNPREPEYFHSIRGVGYKFNG